MVAKEREATHAGGSGVVISCVFDQPSSVPFVAVRGGSSRVISVPFGSCRDRTALCINPTPQASAPWRTAR